MPFCIHCHRHVEHPCVDSNDPGPDDDWFVVVTGADVLRRPRYLRSLSQGALYIMEKEGLTARRMGVWMDERIHGYAGNIIWPDGTRFDRPAGLVIDAFNGDTSFRWIGDFLRFNHERPLRPAQNRVVDRLRVLDLAIQIARPDISSAEKEPL